MLEAPQAEGRQAFVQDLSNMMRNRIAGADVVRQLSTRDGKTLEVLEDPAGLPFVRRTYSPQAVRDIEGSMREPFTFQEAWSALHADFERSDLKIVPSFILNPERKRSEPLVVVSDYIEDPRPVRSASLEAKTKLAKGLGNVLNNSEVVLPQLQMLMPDMFQTTRGVDGQDEVVLTDVDPLVLLRWNLSGNKERKEQYHSGYMDRVGELFFDSWCLPGEHQPVFGALMNAIKDLSLNSDSPSGAMFDSFLRLNMMSNGLDPRGFK